MATAIKERLADDPFLTILTEWEMLCRERSALPIYKALDATDAEMLRLFPDGKGHLPMYLFCEQSVCTPIGLDMALEKGLSFVAPADTAKRERIQAAADKLRVVLETNVTVLDDVRKRTGFTDLEARDQALYDKLDQLETRATRMKAESPFAAYVQLRMAWGYADIEDAISSDLIKAALNTLAASLGLPKAKRHERG